MHSIARKKSRKQTSAGQKKENGQKKSCEGPTEMWRASLLRVVMRLPDCLSCLSCIKSRTVLLRTSTSLSPVMFTPPSANDARSKSVMPSTFTHTNNTRLLHTTVPNCTTAAVATHASLMTVPKWDNLMQLIGCFTPIIPLEKIWKLALTRTRTPDLIRYLQEYRIHSLHWLPRLYLSQNWV